jgi:predicted Rossmann fold nucleotide-binding protein DprA/Smf involved in DNA uptake
MNLPLLKSAPLSKQEMRNWLRLSRTKNFGPITFYRLIEPYGSFGKTLDGKKFAERLARTAQNVLKIIMNFSGNALRAPIYMTQPFITAAENVEESMQYRKETVFPICHTYSSVLTNCSEAVM